MKYISIRNIHYFSIFIILSIFLYIFYFSYRNIINIWSYSEIHLNYSAGFIRRGFLGEIIKFLNSYFYSDKIFFSTIFFLLSSINTIIFLSIVKKITNNISIYIYLALNPSFILFSFYDLGGYARSEIFGIFLMLLHTYIAQKIYDKKINYNQYNFFYFFIFYPFIFIATLIHEINILTILFHLITSYQIIKFYKKNTYRNFIKFLLPIFFFIPLIFFFLTSPISNEMLQIIIDSLKYKENVEIWILESIASPASARLNSEISYMSNPISNVIYYILIFFFYFIPIIFIFNSSAKKYKFIFLLISIIPLFFLFFIGRDWGRWIHIILITTFCFYAQNLVIKKINFKLNNIYKYIVIIIFLSQLLFTRIPHCCNIVSKNIDLVGGLIPKISVFYKMSTNSIDIKERFKTF